MSGELRYAAAVHRRVKVLVCRGPTCGGECNSRALHEEIVAQLERVGDGTDVVVEWWSCFGHCTKGANVLVRDMTGREQRRLAALPAKKQGRSALYSRVVPEDVREIIDEHVAAGRVVRRLVIKPPKPSSSAAQKDGD